MGASESNHDMQQMINEYAEELEKNDAGLDTVDGHVTADPNTHLQLKNGASQSDPNNLREAFVRINSTVDETDAAALKINPATIHYPFENIVMEGGGQKGLAYVGAIKCLEDLGLVKQIKRVGGSSAGAITCALFAFGYSSEEILGFLAQDIESVFMDHSCGYCSLVPNIVRRYGWNPGEKIHEWFGKAIQDQTGNPDSTFRDLYKLRGVELCIVVTNLNTMTAQYCHTKTTPNMPVRDALRQTMGIPGIFYPMPYKQHGITDYYVDGGVLVNYPINCFDGWYLSMGKEDTFLNKMKRLSDMPSLMTPSSRFKPTGPNKTMGFLLYDDSEKELMRFYLESRCGSLEPPRPSQDTSLWLEKEEKKEEQAKNEKVHQKIVNAVDNFLRILSENNDKDPESITREELRAVFNDESFLQEHKELLFGKDCRLDKAFKILDKDGNNKIAYYELIQFIEERGIRMQTRFLGYSRREVNSFPSFLKALQNTLLTNLKYNAVNELDFHRTVGINTGHIETTDFNLVEADRDFVVKRGYNSTMSFLRYYAAENPEDVKPRQVPPHVQHQQPTSIHHSNNTNNSNNNNTNNNNNQNNNNSNQNNNNNNNNSNNNNNRDSTSSSNSISINVKAALLE